MRFPSCATGSKSRIFFIIIVIGTILFCGCISNEPKPDLSNDVSEGVNSLKETVNEELVTQISSETQTKEGLINTNEIVILSKDDLVRSGEYKDYKFEDLLTSEFNSKFQNPGDKFRVEFKSTVPLFIYALAGNDLNVHSTVIPTFKKDTQKVDYHGLSPLMKMEFAYDSEKEFIVKDLSKIAVIVDSRISEADTSKVRDMIKYYIKITKLPDSSINESFNEPTLPIDVFDEKGAVYWNSFRVYNFEDFDVPGLDLSYQNKDEKYRISLDSEDPLMVYVIPEPQVKFLSIETNLPRYDPIYKKYDYNLITPLISLEQVYKEEKEFSPEDFSKLSVVVDPRLSTFDLDKNQYETFKYHLVITKLQ